MGAAHTCNRPLYPPSQSVSFSLFLSPLYTLFLFLFPKKFLNVAYYKQNINVHKLELKGNQEILKLLKLVYTNYHSL